MWASRSRSHVFNRLATEYKYGYLLRWIFCFEVASVHAAATVTLSAVMEISIKPNSLYFLFFLIELMLVIATPPNQPARRDSTWDELSGPLWQQFVDGVLAPAAGITGDMWGGILNEFVGPDTPSESPPKEQPLQPFPGDQPDLLNPAESQTPQLPADSPFTAPETLATDEHECSSPPVGAPDDRAQCAVSVRKIIYALDCADTSQNVAIGDILAKTVRSGTKTSTTVDDDCGVICWTGELTMEGAEKIRRLRGVLAVVPDVTAHEEYTSTPYVSSQKRDESSRSSLVLERRHLVKRDTIVRQEGLTSTELSFISTPEGLSARDCGYVYNSAAGEGIFVYVIDVGAEPSNSEFSSGVIERWLFAYDTYTTQKEVRYKRTGHGSCVASKVAGKQCGVAKKTSLIIVKTTYELSSFIDGITEVLNDVRRLAIAGSFKPGYNVVTMQRSFRGPKEVDKWSKVQITRMISKLISKYGIVFVNSAGNTGMEAGTVGFPASLSPQLPIIVVGSTDDDGIQVATSSRGHQVTVSAPGLVLCADNEAGVTFQYTSGTSFAAPAVAGLAAYYLSVHDIGSMLRNRPTELIPQAVKDYIVKTAYVRPGSNVLSVWNLLNGAKPLSPA